MYLYSNKVKNYLSFWSRKWATNWDYFNPPTDWNSVFCGELHREKPLILAETQALTVHFSFFSTRIATRVRCILCLPTIILCFLARFTLPHEIAKEWRMVVVVQNLPISFEFCFPFMIFCWLQILVFWKTCAQLLSCGKGKGGLNIVL